MPSRKKVKGKLRKAKAASKCCHGFPHDGEVSKIVSLLLSDFKDALPKVIEDAACPNSGYNLVKDILMEKKLLDAWHDKENRESLLLCLSSLATDLLLKNASDQNHTSSGLITIYTGMAGVTAAAMLSLEGGGEIFADAERKVRDLYYGGQREHTKFFRQRISCSCLDAKFKALKKSPKLGACDGCGYIAQRTDLLLCSGCRVSQYCDAHCQRKNWPHHHNYCKDYHWVSAKECYDG